MSKKIYKGSNIIAGGDGRSAYQVWLDQGHVGTESDFLAALKGDKGDTGVSADYPITIYNGLDSTATDEALAANQGKALDDKIGQLGQDVDEDCTVDAKRFIVNEEQHIPYSIANGETVIVRVVKAAGANTSVYARTAINVATGQIQLRSLMYADEAEVTANRSFKYLFFTGENISNGAVVDIIRKGKLWQNVKDNMDLTRYQNPSYPCFVARESNHNDQGCAVFQIYQSDGVQGFFSWVYKAFRYLKLTGFDSTKQYCVTMFRAGYGASNTDFQIRFKELANGSLSNEVSFSIAASSIKVVGGVNRIVATSGNYSLEAIVDYSCVPLYSTINLTVTRFVVAPECFEPTTAALASEVENLNAASLKKSDLGLSIISDNIANPDDIQTDMYVRSDGVVDKQTGWAITSVPVIAGQKVTFGGCKLGRTGYYRFQDANGGKVSSGQYDDPNYRVNPITLDVPATAVLLFIDIASSSSPSDPYSGLQVNLGDTFLPYDEFEKVITSINNEPLAGGASKALEERIENIEDSLATIQEEIGLGMASVIADLPVSDGTDIEVGYAYIDSSSSVVKVKMS